MSLPLLTLELRLEPDIVLARQRARQVAALLGFPSLDQTRIATATSEIARNVFEYAGGGKVEFLIESGPAPALRVRVRERGPGIKDLQALLDGPHESPTGVGLGIIGAKRLMDRFAIASAPGGGAVVTMDKRVPNRSTAFTSHELARFSAALSQQTPQGLFEELQLQNQELLRTLQELRDQQTAVAELHTRELQETNRGVVALYAELDENAKTLRRISELKSRFLSNMSHEFRSPLNTILSLTGFLLDRSDGALTAEQEKQVQFIRKAAEGLSGLVNDLLDLAKVEAGKAVVRPESFAVADLFDLLRDTTVPLIGRRPVALVFEDPAGIPPLLTDESKVAQILRNFLSNAVKFTERGEIRVAATAGPDDSVLFSVADTGIGIAPADRGRIFEEFGQVENPIQGRVKGTGLGLPLSRKLAELLGGTVSVRSTPGVGSTFFAVIPRNYFEAREGAAGPEAGPRVDPGRAPVVVVDDDPMDLLLCQSHLDGSAYQVLPARDLGEARRLLRLVRPSAVVVDVVIDGEEGWKLLAEIKGQDATRDVPVLVVTSLEGRERALALGADAFRAKPVEKAWLVETLDALRRREHVETVLIVDDEEITRYLLKDVLSALGRFVIIEAGDGQEGLRRAHEDHPSVIFLDLVMPDMTGAEVLEQLKSDAETKGIPVIINTSKSLDIDELRRLTTNATAVLTKSAGSREEGLLRVRDALLKAGLGPIPLGVES